MNLTFFKPSDLAARAISSDPYLRVGNNGVIHISKTAADAMEVQIGLRIRFAQDKDNNFYVLKSNHNDAFRLRGKNNTICFSNKQMALKILTHFKMTDIKKSVRFRVNLEAVQQEGNSLKLFKIEKI